jgi:glycerophosphoryl diester phosphodiesterase
MINESQIFFELNLRQALNNDQKILLVGNIPELGSWSLINALPLISENNDLLYRGQAKTNISIVLEYKYIIVEQKGSVYFKWLPEYTNRTYEIKEDNVRLTDHFNASNYSLSSLAFLQNQIQLLLKFEHRAPSLSRTNINGLRFNANSNVNINSIFSLDVSYINESHDNDRAIVQMDKNMGEDMVRIFAKDREKFHFYINIYNEHKVWVGRSVVIDDEFENDSYCGDLTVPVIGEQLTYIGKLTFSYLLINPWNHAQNNLKDVASPTWKPNVDLIGHRGFGKTNHTFVIENTILSFETAYKHGLKFVEFDVHVTQDGVPVIYHDFFIPASINQNNELEYVDVSNISYKKFKSISPMLTNGIGDLNTRKKEFSLKNKREKSDDSILRPRSASTYHNNSLNANNVHHANEYLGYCGPGYKGENRYHFKRHEKTLDRIWKLTDNSFASLKQLFQEIPVDVGFNVEIKYPDVLGFKECHAKERNQMVDLILNVIFENAGPRPLYISSFDPEICILCRQKQSKYHVFFLIESKTGDKKGGRIEYDSRCVSLENAFKFALSMNFRGIVMRADHHLAEHIECIKKINESGLLLFTYGADNNDCEKVLVQKEIGIDVIITDKVKNLKQKEKQISA